MKVLMVASEAAPVVKMGGLGDVVGSLPIALEKQKIDVDVVIPFYSNISIDKYKLYKHLILEVPYGGATYIIDVYKTKLPNSTVDLYLIRNNDFFVYNKTFAKPEVEVYAFFDKCVVEFIKNSFNTYDLIHCHDWHTGLLPHLLQDELGSEKPPVLFTIHNISYQGLVKYDILQDVDINAGAHPSVMYDIQDGYLNFMQQAIMTSDHISTVSEAYAKEILFKDISGDLSTILYDRRHNISGILNGIDYTNFKRDFADSAWKKSKSQAKKELFDELNLDGELEVPLFSFISRLDPNQKGLDILFGSLTELLDKYGHFILLGTGDPVWEEKFKSFSASGLKHKIHVKIAFDNDLARRIYKASDFFIIPSKFEPCGLTQMISMNYGTLPIVRDTGGLKDSVIDSVNGFKFKNYSSKDLLSAIKKAITYYNDEKAFSKLVHNALDADFSWNSSALEYKKMYKHLLSKK